MDDKDNDSVVIARVSSKGQEDEGYSLDSQVKLLEGYCRNAELNNRKTYKITESASKSMQRKIFKEAMKFIADNNIKNLVVEKVDRHVRNLHDAVDTYDWLNEDETRCVHFVKDSLTMHKNSRSQEWLNWGIRVVMAKNYIDNLREEAMKGWAEKLAQGWLPAPPPPGYMTVIENGKRIHVPNPRTSKSMQKVLLIALKPHETVESVRGHMMDFGIVTKNGRAFSKSAVHRILQNPFYMGINRHNGKDYPGKQIPLISEEHYLALQKKLSRNRPVKYRKHNPVFKGILTCGYCNKNITWQLQKGRLYGSCQRKLPECKAQQFVREDAVITKVGSMLDDLVCPSQPVISWLTNLLRSEFQLTVDNRKEAEDALNSRIARIKRMDEVLYDDKLAGAINVDKYQSKHEEFTREMRDLTKKLGGISDEYRTAYMNGINIIELSQVAKRQFMDKNVENDDKRVILTKLFKSMSLKDNTVSVIFTNLTYAIATKSLKSREILQNGQFA